VAGTVVRAENIEGIEWDRGPPRPGFSATFLR
jgi:hypothetical protein